MLRPAANTGARRVTLFYFSVLHPLAARLAYNLQPAKALYENFSQLCSFKSGAHSREPRKKTIGCLT